MDFKSKYLFPVFYVENDEDSRYRASIVLNMIDCCLVDKEPTDGDFEDMLVLAPCPSEGKYTEIMERLGGALRENAMVYTFPGFDSRDWDQLASFAVNTIQASTPKKFFPTKRSAMRFLWTGLAEIAKTKEIAKKCRYNYYEGKKKNDYTEIDGLWRRLVGINSRRDRNERRLEEHRSRMLAPLSKSGNKIANDDKQFGEEDRKNTFTTRSHSDENFVRDIGDDVYQDKKAELQNKNATMSYIAGPSEFAEILAGDSSDDDVLLTEFIERVKALKLQRQQSKSEY